MATQLLTWTLVCLLAYPLRRLSAMTEWRSTQTWKKILWIRMIRSAETVLELAPKYGQQCSGTIFGQLFSGMLGYLKHRVADKRRSISWKTQNVAGEIALWGNREQYGQGEQKTEKVGGLWRRATYCSGRTQPRIELVQQTGAFDQKRCSCQ